MHKARLEAFSDAAIAIFMTIMVLELHPPHGSEWAALHEALPTLGAYLLSFVFIAIYWVNHHHLIQAVRTISGPVLWANMHLMFWLSLVSFATNWIGEHPGQKAPVALYGLVLIMCAIAYTILYRVLKAHEGPDSKLAQAVGADIKGWVSLGIYAAGVALAFFVPYAAMACYALVAVTWFIPDSRIERTFRAG